MDEIKNEESWNKKRIFAAIFLAIGFIIGIFFLKNQLLGDETVFINSSPSDYSKSVKGASAEKNPDPKKTPAGNINLPQIIRDKIEGLKQEAASLNIAEIASSSPQLQKIINDIKSLEQYPANQAKEICKQICGL